jgi:hypothetical protein
MPHLARESGAQIGDGRLGERLLLILLGDELHLDELVGVERLVDLGEQGRGNSLFAHLNHRLQGVGLRPEVTLLFSSQGKRHAGSIAAGPARGRIVPMLIPQRRHWFAAGVALPAAGVVLLAFGCAGRRAVPVTHPPTAETSAVATETPAPATEAPAPAKRRLSDLCRQAEDAPGVIDEARQRLEESFCAATLWFDGVLGGEPDPTNARKVSGRVEVSALHTEAEGFDPKMRLRLRYDLPTLKRRFNVFLGRDDRDEFVEDRGEGFAIRSSVFGLESDEKWLAGLGYSPPGRFHSKVDFRVGARLKSESEIFVQGRWRRNFFTSENNVWRLRETVFWENRDGFGSTTSLDLDHVLSKNFVLRWGNVGTVSEVTEGLSWRTATVLYHNLGGARSGAAELFGRGSTGSEVSVREYGARVLYRQSLGKPYFFGTLVGGYTWPRREEDPERNGSTMVGVGLELHFGQSPP